MVEFLLFGGGKVSTMTAAGVVTVVNWSMHIYMMGMNLVMNHVIKPTHDDYSPPLKCTTYSALIMLIKSLDHKQEIFCCRFT